MTSPDLHHHQWISQTVHHKAEIAHGSAAVDAETGAPLQFFDESSPTRQFLLDERQTWHSVEHSWGSGHVITDRGTHRWNRPTTATHSGSLFHTTYPVGPHLELQIHRRYEDRLHETYSFTNTSTRPITVTSIGVQTPFADFYASSERSLSEAVHAHIFTGGRWAWALAQPMDGAGRVLGLLLRAGHISSYSIESRNQYTLSNIRGHIVLHPTDAARNSSAFGGQPQFTLQPNEVYELRWEIGLFDDVADFLTETHPPMELERLSAKIGEPIIVTDLTGPLTVDDPHVEVHHQGLTAQVTAHRSGVQHLRVNGCTTEIAFHHSVEDVVRTRVDYILNHQLTPERPGLLRYGIVPVDTSSGLTQSMNGWSDWTDGSERIGMALLLQQAQARGWAPERVDDLLTGWSQMAETHLLDTSRAPRRGSQDWATPVRLYDSPWLAQFFIDRFGMLGDPHHLELAATILERAFELGASRFLAIGSSEAGVQVIAALEDSGQRLRANSLREHYLESAEHFVRAGRSLPAHEVNYEQSIVAPLIDLLIDAHQLSGDTAYADEIASRLPWLRAFGGPQPHVRLRNVSIRHWDGYWFGTERLWGDVFPHYWSSLTSAVLLRLPEQLRTEESDRAAMDVLRANLLNYFDDGSATCAFVMPSTVDGRAAHIADRLANDQDRHLSIWLRLADTHGVALD